MWKSDSFPTENPHVYRVFCGFYTYFSTSCGKPCGKEEVLHIYYCIILWIIPKNFVFTAFSRFFTVVFLISVVENPLIICGKFRGRCDIHSTFPNKIHKSLWIYPVSFPPNPAIKLSTATEILFRNVKLHPFFGVRL